MLYVDEKGRLVNKDRGERGALNLSSYLYISKFEYLTSDNISVFEYSNHIFMMSISNHILSYIADTIHI